MIIIYGTDWTDLALPRDAGCAHTPRGEVRPASAEESSAGRNAASIIIATLRKLSDWQQPPAVPVAHAVHDRGRGAYRLVNAGDLTS
eukprot:COSAG02_NODE_445_length_22163_cov_55.680611_7_plen_87_part_00